MTATRDAHRASRPRSPSRVAFRSVRSVSRDAHLMRKEAIRTQWASEVPSCRFATTRPGECVGVLAYLPRPEDRMTEATSPEIPSITTLRLEHLPIIGQALARLGLRDVVDGQCPPDPRLLVTHGECVEATCVIG